MALHLRAVRDVRRPSRVDGDGRGGTGPGDAGPAGRFASTDRWPAGSAHRGDVLPARRDAGAAPRTSGSALVSAVDAVAAVRDPELRVLTIAELGILRDVTVHEGQVEVTITPTYAGCP